MEPLLRNVRKRKLNLGLIEAARLLELDPGSLSRIERGEQQPRRATATRLADLYGITIGDVYANPLVSNEAA